MTVSDIVSSAVESTLTKTLALYRYTEITRVARQKFQIRT